MGNDRVEIGVFRLPAEGRLEARRVRNQRIAVAQPARLQTAVELVIRHPVHRVQHFIHGKAPAIAAVHGERAGRIGHQRLQCQHMGGSQIADMDVIAHAGAIRRCIVGAEHAHRFALAECRFDGDLDEMGRARSGLPAACLRVSARNVEIAQHAEVHRMRGGDIGEHLFGHQLRPAIRVDRTLRRILTHSRHVGDAIGRRGRGEDEVRHLRLHRRRDQRATLGGVVLVIFERIGDALGHHDRSGKVHDGARTLLGKDARHQIGIGNIAFVQGHAVGNGEAEVTSTEGLLSIIMPPPITKIA